MLTIQHKAEIAYCTGDTVIHKDDLSELLIELGKYNGVFHTDIEMDDLVLVKRSS